MLNTSLFKKWISRIQSESFLPKESMRMLNISRTTTIYENTNELIKTIKMSEDMKIQETFLPAPSYDEPTYVLNTGKSNKFAEMFGKQKTVNVRLAKNTDIATEIESDVS
jgi:hypothetical protein